MSTKALIPIVESQKPLEGGLNRGLANGWFLSNLCGLTKKKIDTRYIVVRYYDLRPLPKLLTKDLANNSDYFTFELSENFTTTLDFLAQATLQERFDLRLKSNQQQYLN